MLNVHAYVEVGDLERGIGNGFDLIEFAGAGYEVLRNDA